MLFLLFPFRVMWCLVLSSLATSFSPLLSLQCPLFVALTVSVIQFPVFFVEARARKICGVYLESIKRSLWLFPDLVLSFVFLCSVQLVVVSVDRGSLGSLKFDLQC
ncbi:hypothetical protein Bca4012_013835 [Brassica carinata]|uniref:Uncharacterized protein n=1 Tax=Brassica carinata TaxID=52824 RepID=A0A8X7QNJ2_BRACI|nr:hypothetical protein Bca52824_065488 [Brassica carinata]